MIVTFPLLCIKYLFPLDDKCRELWPRCTVVRRKKSERRVEKANEQIGVICPGSFVGLVMLPVKGYKKGDAEGERERETEGEILYTFLFILGGKFLQSVSLSLSFPFSHSRRNKLWDAGWLWLAEKFWSLYRYERRGSYDHISYDLSIRVARRVRPQSRHENDDGRIRSSYAWMKTGARFRVASPSIRII